jgi:phosphatidate cytidylyltransferase
VKQRLIVGLTGLAILLPALIWGGAAAVSVLVALALLVCLEEYAGMAAPDHKVLALSVLAPAGLGVHLVWTFAPDHAAPAMAIATMLCLSVPMFRLPNVDDAARVAVRLGFGVMYAPLMLVPLVWLRRESDGLALVFLVLAVTWLGDTGAYFAGRFAGKTPLFPRVSPKKTREGVVGGMMLSVVGACAVKAIGGVNIGWAPLVTLAIVLDLAGVVGDLTESLLKRAWGVKDSGWIMPGHGGILDRVDALLFTAPLLWGYVHLTR